MLEMAVEDQEDIEVREVGLDRLEEIEQWDQSDPLDQGDFREGMDYPQLGVHLRPQARNTSYFQYKFKHHWYGEFFPLFRRITESCDAISTKCESKHGRTPKYDCQKSITPRTGTGALGGEHPAKGI